MGSDRPSLNSGQSLNQVRTIELFKSEEIGQSYSTKLRLPLCRQCLELEWQIWGINNFIHTVARSNYDKRVLNRRLAIIYKYLDIISH